MSERVIKKRLKQSSGVLFRYYPDTKEKADWLINQTESQGKSMNRIINEIVDFYWQNYQE